MSGPPTDPTDPAGLLGDLPEPERTRTLELGAFAAGADVPRGLAYLLWLGVAGWDPERSSALLDELADRSLFDLTGADGQWLRLPDATRELLRAEAGPRRLAAASAGLLDGVADQVGDGRPHGRLRTPWWRMPAGAVYLWRHLCQHLSEAGDTAELVALVTDPRWIAARTEQHGRPAALADLALAGFGGGPPGPNNVRPWPELPDVLAPPGHTSTLLRPPLRFAVAWQDLDHGPTPRRSLRVDEPRWWIQAVAPDGDWFTTVGSRLELRDATTAEVRFTFEAYHVRACAVAPDGRWLVTADAEIVQAHDTQTGEVRFRVDHPIAGPGSDDELPSGPEVTCCAIAPDGTWFVTGTADGGVYRWDAATGASAGRPLASPGDGAPVAAVAAVAGVAGVAAVAFAPDGGWLVTVRLDGLIRVHDPATGAVHSFPSGDEGPCHCVVTPDGQWIVVYRPRGFSLFTRDGTRVRQHPTDLGRVTGFSRTADGRWLVVSDAEARLHAWNPVDGSMLGTVRLPPGELDGSVVAPDGSWLATVDRTGSGSDIRIWDFPDVFDGEPLIALRCCAAAPDGSWLAVGGEHGTLRVHDPRTGRVRRRLHGHTATVTWCAATTDRLVSRADGEVRIWAAGTGEPVATLASDGPCLLAPDGRWLATIRGRDIVLSTLDGASRHVVPVGSAGSPGFTWGATAVGGGIYLVDAGGGIRLLDTATGELRALATGVGGWPSRLTAPDGSVLVDSGRPDWGVLVMTPGRHRLLAAPGDGTRPSELVIAPHGRYAAAPLARTGRLKRDEVAVHASELMIAPLQQAWTVNQDDGRSVAGRFRTVRGYDRVHAMCWLPDADGLFVALTSGAMMVRMDRTTG